jgi:hypothetical protein
MYVIFSRKHPRISTKSVMRNLEDELSIQPFTMGFDLALGFQLRQSVINSLNQQFSAASKASPKNLVNYIQISPRGYQNTSLILS